MSAGSIVTSALDATQRVGYLPPVHFRPGREAPAPPPLPKIVILASAASDREAQVRGILLAAGGYDVSSHLSAASPPDLLIPILSRGQDPRPLLAETRQAAPQAKLLPVLDETYLSVPLDRLLPGVTDFLVGPVRAPDLLTRVRRLLSQNGSQEIPRVKDRLIESVALSRLRGEDPAFVKVKVQSLFAAKSDVTVLLTGETGTGKELIAQAIHYLSDRASKPFLPVNCGAIPGELFENEFFGHLRGAFTDARSHRPGLIAEAEGGTLFLDEVDALTPSTQVKLLHFLEDGSYRPLGSSRPLKANVRLVAATNADLRQKVREGTFRDDLFYRLNVVTLYIPPLGERGGDIVLLAEHFLHHYGKNDDRWRFSPQALEALREHAWPGNVRELENVVRHVVVMNSPKLIEPEDLPLPILPVKLNQGDASFRTAKAGVISRFERSYLEELMRTYRGNITRAAQAAGKDRRTFRRLLKKHGLHPSVWARPLA